MALIYIYIYKGYRYILLDISMIREQMNPLDKKVEEEEYVTNTGN
jgi:hypothetical protein